VSTPRSLRLPRQVSQRVIETPRGSFAALVAQAFAGVSERSPALLVPGYTGSKEDFIAVLESLAAAGRPVAAIDMRGQHQSPPAPSGAGYALDQLAADLLAVAAEFSDATGRVHLLGHSFGGIVAREAVLARPAAFWSLTLLGSGPGTIGGDRAQALHDLLDHLRPAEGRAEELAERIAQVWDSRLEPQARAENTAPDIIDFLRSRLLGSCPVGLATMAGQLLDCPDRTSELASIEPMPKLISYGENDDAWPPDIQDLMARRLGAERICIPGAAHSPAVEAPETTAAMLTAFWNRAEPPWRALSADDAAP
jgi:pimeloyl-ACP methyl ester carboxylesterase